MRVAVIPARGGSRRIPRKNIRSFHGKPIIAYSIEAAKKSGLFQAIYVSTEDSGVADVALDCGAIVIRRPWRLAKDEVGTQEVMRDVLNGMSYEYACCIYATAPLMSVSDLRRGFDLISAYEVPSSPEYRWLREYAPIEARRRPVHAISACYPPLQDAAQFYWSKASALLNGVPYFGTETVLVPIAPERVCDINVEDDWKRAEEMYAALQHNDALNARGAM
jgi:pseudaminic acid cytidylyltransferase